ncbi:MAG: AmmeMemoRadiSam system protein B [Spirochaetaceae bacterium]|nr:AmmeMemoRadiSam system protein B [Spirochaetaceae bacterium]
MQARTIRSRTLPEGWYPSDSTAIRRLYAEWTSHVPAHDAVAVVAPHAGWYFSGDLAALAIHALGACDTVIVCGGHLRAGDPLCIAKEDAFDCTVRIADSDTALLQAFLRTLQEMGIEEIEDDIYPDNSVEVLLPLAALRFPDARMLCMRMPPDYKAREAGLALAAAALETGRKVGFIASTDLTHYGPNYHYMPRGVGPQAETWVREKNDRALIDAALAMDTELVLKQGREVQAACSAGAVAAAIAFAQERGAVQGILMRHKLSSEVMHDLSFVGYAAIAFTAGNC